MSADGNDSCPVNAWGKCLPERSCVHIMKIDTQHQCSFVKQTPDCVDDASFIDYMTLFACHLDYAPGLPYVWVIVIAIELTLMFMALSAVADYFFAPSLCAISKLLHLSEHVAGVTLLAFGNAFVDFVTSIASATCLGPEMVVCQLYGGCLFTITIVMAAIIFSSEFYITALSFVRDLIFFIIAVSYVYYVVHDNTIYLYETLSFLVLYLIYIVIVVLHGIMWRKLLKQHANTITRLLEGEERTKHARPRAVSRAYLEAHRQSVDNGREGGRYSTYSNYSTYSTESGQYTRRSHLEPVRLSNDMALPPKQVARERAASSGLANVNLYIEAERLAVLETTGNKEQAQKEIQENANRVAIITEDGTVLYEKPRYLFADLLLEINPIPRNDWRESGCCYRFALVAIAPVVFFGKLAIPVVDHGALNKGWCKMLNTIHCVVTPLFIVLTFAITDYPCYVYVPVLSVVFALGMACAIYVFKNSRMDRAPWFHSAFAYLGFLASMVMVYLVAHELVYMVNVMGNVLQIRVETLAMTLLTWANSVSDMASDTALAKAGYPQMAAAGCYGTPILSLLLGAGVSLAILVETTGSQHVLKFKARFEGLVTTCFVYLVVALCTSLFIIPSMNFQCRKYSCGLYLIILYIMFVIYLFLCEAKLTHPLDVIRRNTKSKYYVYK